MTWLSVPNLSHLGGSCFGVLITIKISSGNQALLAISELQLGLSGLVAEICAMWVELVVSTFFHLLITCCIERTETLKQETQLLGPKNSREMIFHMAHYNSMARHTWTEKTLHWLMVHFY